MKRRDFIALSVCAAPLALSSSTLTEALGLPTGNNQRTTSVRLQRKDMSAQEIKEFEDAQVEDFGINSLPPAQRRAAEEMAAVASAFVLKGLLNRLNPETYPVPRTATAPEAKAAALARRLDDRVFARLRPKLERAVREPARIQRFLGPLQTLDLRQDSLQPSLGPLARHNSRQLTKTEDFVPVSGNAYNPLHLVLRAVHCIDETNPETGADSIVLGGLLIGASGHVTAFPAVVCGDFNEREHAYQNFGEYHLGQYSLNTTSGYPKSFYAIFILVESDGDEPAVAAELTDTLSYMANTFLNAIGGDLVGQTATAVNAVIGLVISYINIDEDMFPPYCVRLTMSNSNPFGGPASPKMRTGNIIGQGGVYRIGYRYVLNA